MGDADPCDTLYLDHAATRWPKAVGVAEAMSRAAHAIVGSAGRSTSFAATSAFASPDETIERCRSALARLAGIADPMRLLLTRGCTDALNLAILGVLSHRADQPHVVSTVLEHNAVRRPLRHLASRGIISHTEVTCDDDGFVSPVAIASACRADTAMIACPHASNVIGTIQDVRAIADAVRGVVSDAIVLIDAAQTAGVLDLSPSALSADLIAFGCHKAIGGPAGIGALFVGSRAFDSNNPRGSPLQPIHFGGTGESGNATNDELPLALPARFEVGSRDAVAAAGVLAALASLPAHGPRDATLRHEQALCAKLIDGVRRLPGVRVLGTHDASRRVGVVSLVCETMPAHDLAAVLASSFSIVTRAGLHCAPAAHAAMRSAESGALRLSVGPTTTDADVDRVLDALHRVLTA